MSFDWSTTGLPNPSTDLSMGLESSVIRTKMDSGRIRQRQRFTSALRTIPISWLLDKQDYAIFQAVWLYKLHGGADKFLMSLDLGDGFQNYTVQFVGEKWSASYKEVDFWKVTATVECDVGSPITEAELDDLLS